MTEDRIFEIAELLADEVYKENGVVMYSERQELTSKFNKILIREMPTENNNINAILSKFENGLALYQNNAVFANCVEHLLRGGDVYKILEQIIVMQENTQKRLEEIIESGTLRQEIIVSKERFDEIKDKGL